MSFVQSRFLMLVSSPRASRLWLFGLALILASTVQLRAATVALTGTVFEDVNYSGGAGRSNATASGSVRSGARVELYTGANYTSFTTTDASGNYSFTVNTSASYTIRVVNSTVTSSLGGASLIPVQTYRTTATTGAAVAVTDHVGGEDPTKADSGNGSTTLAALTAGSLTPQSITSVTVGVAAISGLDFGFNFNTIVNTNDTGQGSLRQMITNSSGMSGTQTTIFMISDGSAHAGLRAGLTNQLTSGVAVITLASQLPTPADTITFDGTTQTTNIGDTNSGTLGAGSTVGTDGVSFSTVNRPEVEIVGSSSIGSGILMGQNNSTLKGFSIHGFGSGAATGDVVVGGTGLTITQNIIGTTATSFSLPGSGASGGSAIRINASSTGSMTNNLIGYQAYNGVYFLSSAGAWTVSQNEFRGNGRSGGSAAVFLSGSSSTISQNLFAANKGNGVDCDSAASASSAHTLQNNTFSGNGVGTTGTRAIAAIRLYGNTNIIDRNIITTSYGPGVLVTSGSTGNKITQNSIYNNGTVTNDSAQAATGQLGIDLLASGNDASLGTSPYITVNDSGDGDTGANNLLNFPVLNTAITSGSNITLTGWARPGSIIEFFISDSASNGFGQGQTYLTTLTEGSGSDTDATTSSAYTNPVNGLNQGADTTNKFSFTIATPGGVSAGTKLTATARDGSNNTSEFSGQVTVAAATITLSGNVSEDTGYTGGSGRDKATASGVNRSGARVELYDGSGNYVSATTTDASGNYSFTVTNSLSYTIRVVNSTVTSSLGGASLIPVQTYRTTATSGSAVAVTDRVGGEDPTKADAGNGSTTLAALTSGSLTPQSITSVTAGTSNITGLDFVYNFNTIVNTNDTGQGSLRQMITNANGMSGTQATVFMISDGSAHNGLRAGLTNQLTSGVAVITPATALPSITGTITIDGTSQTTNIGNTNAGTLGTGGTVGVDAVTLSTVNRPEVEIVGTTTIAAGLNVQAASSTIKGIAIHGFGSATTDGDIAITSVASITINQCMIGTTASSFSVPTAASGAAGVYADGVTSASITNNLIGFVGHNGIYVANTAASGCTIQNNEFRGNGLIGNGYGGLNLLGSSHTVTGNLMIANKGQGIDVLNATGGTCTFLNNTVSGNGVGNPSATEDNGIRLATNNNTLDRNIVTANYGSGIAILNGATGNKITQNSIYLNGTITDGAGHAATAAIGIDLLSSTETTSGNQNLGVSPFYTINDSGDADTGGNTLLNFPVLNTAITTGSNITLTGWARPGSIIEFFISDGAANGFGQGQTYIATATEGSGSDTDATTGTYGPAAVNGVTQGTDTTNKFSFTIATPAGVSAGTKLTATARDASNNTSEFSGQVTVAASTITLSGNVAEDTTYTGGVGRSKATASGVNIVGARVELYDASGNYVSATTTDASGNYSFTVTNSLSYTIRVVNSSVVSTLGAGTLGVQTYRTTATSGSAVAVTDRVGGEDPTKADAGNGSTTLAALTTSSLTPQSITSVTAGTSNITGLDFVYNFNTIVNTNDSGQGSLRQFITNADAMTGTQTTAFMISDGSAHSGLRAGLTNQLTSGVAVITPVTALPSMTGSACVIDGTTQTTNIGDTNSGTLGTGGTVGVGAVSLSTVNKPEVEIVGTTSITKGLEIQAASCTIKGISIHGFGGTNTQADIYIGSLASATVTQNIIGASASSFTLPTAATGGHCIYTDAPTGASITNNLIGFAGYGGVTFNNASAASNTVQNNEIQSCGRSSATRGGIEALGSSHTFTGNLIYGHPGQGIDLTATAGGSCTILNNTIYGCGVGNASVSESSGIRLNCSSNTVDRNKIYSNYGAGVMVGSSATGNKITQNSIYSNGTVLSTGGAAATAQVGIDLLSSTDSATLGTAPYYTINDSGDGDTGANNLLNFPVLDKATISGTNLILTGWARPGSIIEFFVSDSAASGFGQGQTYFASLTEGGGSDTDATSSSYTNPVNGLNQGADTTNRFKYTLALPGSVTAGAKLTATATDGSNNTSEFSGQVTVAYRVISGRVYEDTGYTGGSGRSYATASGVGASGARVELFDGSGNYSAFTTTDSSGNYSFNVADSTSYTVRVVNSTVISSLGGSSLLPVQTYRTTCTTGSAVAVTDRVGGEDPTKADAGNGSTTLAALTAGSLTPQSITSVTVGTADVTGVDFGYNFNTIVNKNDTGQGSLRQMITNANGMTGTQTSIFMISDGSAHNGLRAGLTNQLTSGVAVITLSSALPQVTDTITLDATTQTSNIGNTNAGTLGAGGTVGVDAISLSTVNRPEVEINCNAANTNFNIAAANSTIKGFALHGSNGFGTGEILVTGVNGVTITQNIIGTTASSFSLPGSGTGDGAGIVTSGTSTSGTITNNLIGYMGNNGLTTGSATSGWTISQNEFRGNGRWNTLYGGSDLLGSSHTVSQNLFIANKSGAIDNYSSGNNSHTIINNTITGNGVGTTGSREDFAVRLTSNNCTVDRNIIYNNYGAGVLVHGGTGNKITKNSIYGNGTITNDSAEAASGELGIDLQASGDNANLGTAPYYTINDSGDGDSGGNNLLNFPVLDQAVVSGSNLILTGWARPGSIIEFFVSDGASNGFGQGQTYIATATEGSGSDTDATSSTYGAGAVNGIAQGTDTTNRFSFTIALPGGVAVGTKLTATATDASNNTSEFSGQVTVSSVTLSGNVFEDTSYTGGVGRDKATASGVNVSGARVELYDGSGNYVSATTTDASGNYSFASLTSSSSYTVRVVNSTVVSSLGGTSLLPVQTYRTTATTGSAVAVTDRVGGEDPTKADAGNGSTTLAALTAGSLTPQSITSVTPGGNTVTGINFGFNFNTIVNTNNSGQGSLRQFITNANGMTGTQTTVFMISDGSAHAGLRAGLTNQLTSGVAVITPATALPSITGATTIDGTSQTTNIGDTNSGTLGTGGTVGVDDLTLSTVNKPEVEIVGSSSITSGLDLQANTCTIKGISIHGFGNSSTTGDITTGTFSPFTITQNIIGASATSFSAPAATTGGNGIYTGHSDNGSVTNNLIGFTGYNGVYISNIANTGWTVQNNEVRGCGTANSGYGGVDLLGSSHTITGNLFIANKGEGIDLHNSTGGSITILNNNVTGNGIGNASVLESPGIRLSSNNNTVDRNKVYANYGAGVLVASSGTGNKITRNSIYSNGTILSGAGAAASNHIGIDLLSSTDDSGLGTAPYYTVNDSGDGDTGGNNLLNFPVLDQANISGSNLVVTGWARPGSVIELFISDGATNGFGQGQTYLTSLTEGGGSDTDATSSSYTNPVNGLNQGADTTNRFQFSFALPGGVSNGTKLTATATDASNNTSEFSGQITVGTMTLSGKVYEDTTYSGGAGRSFATASGTNVSGARVELFDSSGAYVSATTTDASGNYSFSGINPNTTYTVRVVNSTVVSSLGGTSLLPVQTYRTTATTGSAVAVTDRVGGEDPTKADAGNGSTTLAALTAGSLTPQSITSVTVSTSAISGLDFGYNFCTIVNKNDTGQGSLRQFITNANGMSGTQSSVFMISDGSAHAGLRAGLTNQLTSGVAVITVATALPQITGTLTLDATTQTTNVGDTNSGTLGTGGTVGTGAVTLSTVNKPEVEIVGANSINYGLDIAANTTTIKGIAIHGFGSNNTRSDIHLGAFTGITITQNIIGATASSFSLPGTATGGNGVRGESSSGATLSNNLIGFTAYEGVLAASGSAAWTIQNNEIRGCGTADASTGGVNPGGASSSITGNLIIANKGRGSKTDADSCTFTNNSITGNGVGTVGTAMTPGLRLRTNNNTVTSNIIYNNYGAGIMVTSTGTGNRITQNSIYGNGTIVNDASAAATGNVGIDLQAASDNASTGTAPYYTINDSGDGDTGGNNILNFPVLDTAIVSGTNLVLTGWARPGSIIEFFISDGSTNGFGQGQTYLTSLTEGGGSDTDATSSSYTNPVNGLNQGADTTNRFTFTIALPGGVSIGTKLTATATDGSNNTSEFSGQVTVSGITLSGNVFEDVTYSGGVGRNKATASGVNVSGARVELFDGSGNYVSTTTTDASGNYSFTGLTGGSSYTVRVVNSTVASSLGGTSLIPVQTYRTTATTGSAVAVTDRVGGEDPTKADAGNGSTTLAALTTGSLTPQSITSVTAATSSISGLDFGYNFNTIVNKNDTGQGSLRQMITNANGMSGTQTSVFMISDGSAHSGLRAGLTNQLTSGVATITLASLLPQITGTITLDATTQTTNIGDTNAGTLGTGGTVGVDGLSLSTVNRPEVEIITSSLTVGLDIAGANSTIKGFAIHGAGTGEAEISMAANGITITQNVLCTTATSFTLPGSNASAGQGIRTSGTLTSGTITNNLIGFANYQGLLLIGTTSGFTVSGNEIRGSGRSSATLGGMDLLGTGHTISGNLFIASKGQGIDNWQGGHNSHTIVNNTISGNGVGTVGGRENSGIRIVSNNYTIDRNIISNNYGAGIIIANGATGNKITKNSIYGNGSITNDSAEAATGNVGIDLQVAGNDSNVGTAPYYTINDSGDGDSGGNNALNFPVLDQANISGSNLVITGWARPGSIIELFISDGASNGFGQGQTYLTTLTEGSGSDTDATSSSYTNPVNGLNQGADTTNRFQFSFALPGGVSNGTKLTATATDASNNTSEFSGQITVGTMTLSGKVYEDTTYSGGVGRSFATASGTNVSGARVELFDSSGAYVSATTTDASGNYSFSSISPSTTYTVRVVNSTVVSSLGGTSLLPVQTYRTTATTGSAVAVTDRVGGEDPTKADAGNGSTTLAALTAGSLTPQSITSVTVSTSAISGLDFGYNFCTVVNKNDTGQGSLRQFITNANGMSGTQSSVFMISDGSAHAGLRAGLTNQLTSGVAVITVATALPSITGATTIDGTTQTTNVGDTNAGALGTGGTVGVDGLTLSTVNRPEVEIVGTSSITKGFDITAAGTTIKGLSIHGFGTSTTTGDISVNAATTTITQCVLGTTATSFSLPASNTTGGCAIAIAGGSTGSVTNNLIGYTSQNGLRMAVDTSASWTISNNEYRGVGIADASRGAITLRGSSHTVSGNLAAACKGVGVSCASAGTTSVTILNNTVTGCGVGVAGTLQNSGMQISGTNQTIDRNKIYANYGSGILIQSASTGNKITRNSIYSNGTITNDASSAATGAIGIDLQSASDNGSLGTAPYYTLNDDGDADTGGNNLLNYPVLDNAMIIGGNLEITGWAPTGATIEFFISDGDPSNFGEGQTYIGSVVEGGGSDTDATSSSYSGNVNCFAQGSGTNVHRFKYTFANPGGITAGTTKLTATATDGSNNTSEFSGNVVVYNSNPIFTIVTSSATISDPVNGATNPKAIPGGVLLFTATVTNSYQARADADSFIYTNPIPTNTKLYIGNLGGAGSGPVIFTDGATTSALTYTFTSLASTTDDLSFSNDGGSTWTYVPSADADTCDANVTNIRINPKGTFAKSACGNNPSCVFQYRLRVK